MRVSDHETLHQTWYAYEALLCELLALSFKNRHQLQHLVRYWLVLFAKPWHLVMSIVE